MKRFFTKKSVAIIFTAIIALAVFSPFNFVNAQNTDATIVSNTKGPIPPTWYFAYPDGSNTTFSYKGSGNWYSNTPANSSGFYEHGSAGQYSEQNPIYTQSELSGTPYNMPVEISNLATAYDTALQAYNTSIGREAVNQNTVWDIIWGGLSGTVGTISMFAADKAAGVIAVVLEFVTIPIASFLLAVAGSILDFSVKYTIYGSGFASINSSIQTVWVLLRDTANVFFIFILLYAAIKQIVTGAAAQKILMSIIISAVLINFSFFITRIVVDASNLVATSIFNQIQTSTATSTSNAKAVLAAVGATSEIDLSGRIMDGLNLTTIYDGPANNNSASSAASIIGIGGLLNSFTRLVLFLITTFVFFALAALFVGRFVTIAILLATSPIGFVGDVIPGVGSFSSSWRKSLQDQVLMAPVIMFFLLLTIKLSQNLGKVTSTDKLAVFFNFFLVSYLLLKSISIAKSMSGSMGNFVDKIAAVGTGLALGAASGGTALIARQTVGRASTALAGSKFADRLQNLAPKGGVSGWMAKQTLGGIKGTAASTFDLRNTGTFKETLGRAEGVSGMTMVNKNYLAASGVYGKGKGQTTGFSGGVAAETKKVQETAAAYSKMSKEETVTEKKAKVDLAEYTKKEAELTKNLQTANPTEKEKLEKELKVVVEQKTKATGQTREGKEKELDKIVNERSAAGQHQDFSTADAKVKQFQEELKKYNEGAEDEKKKLIAQGKDVSRFEKDVSEVNKKKKEEITRLEKVIADETDRQGKIRKQVEGEIMAGGKSDLKLMLDRREMKQTYADSIRTGIISTLTHLPSEREALAKAAEGTNFKEKTPEEKNQDKLSERFDKLEEELKASKK